MPDSTVLIKSTLCRKVSAFLFVDVITVDVWANNYVYEINRCHRKKRAGIALMPKDAKVYISTARSDHD